MIRVISNSNVEVLIQFAAVFFIGKRNIFANIKTINMFTFYIPTWNVIRKKRTTENIA